MAAIIAAQYILKSPKSAILFGTEALADVSLVPVDRIFQPIIAPEDLFAHDKGW